MEKVLVTGASGFIAEHCIIELLKNGYLVRGSLRTMNREQEVRDAIRTETDAVSYTHLTLPTTGSV